MNDNILMTMTTWLWSLSRRMTGTNPLCKMRTIILSVGSDSVYIGSGSISRVRKYGEAFEENLEPTSGHTLCSVQEGKGWGAGCDFF